MENIPDFPWIPWFLLSSEAEGAEGKVWRAEGLCWLCGMLRGTEGPRLSWNEEFQELCYGRQGRGMAQVLSNQLGESGNSSSTIEKSDLGYHGRQFFIFNSPLHWMKPGWNSINGWSSLSVWGSLLVRTVWAEWHQEPRPLNLTWQSQEGYQCSGKSAWIQLQL